VKEEESVSIERNNSDMKREWGKREERREKKGRRKKRASGK
jgi:hypothetical protein